MTLDSGIRERVLLAGGKVIGVDCPSCSYSGDDVDLDTHSLEDVSCPECGTMILTADDRSALRRAHKL